MIEGCLDQVIDPSVETVVLDIVPCLIAAGGTNISVEGKFILRKRPNYRLEYHFVAPNVGSLERNREYQFGPRFAVSGMIEVFGNCRSEVDSMEIIALPNPQRVVCDYNRPAVVARFCIPNFPDFLSSTDDISTSRRMGYVKLVDADWIIEIYAHEKTHDAIKFIKAQHSMAITHFVRISKINQQEFEMRECESKIEDISRLMSFVAGQSVTPIIVEATDGVGRTSYEMWELGRITSWHHRGNWFDVFMGDSLSAVYASYLEVARKFNNNGAISRIIEWYIRASESRNGGAGMEVGIIVSQAALELLEDAVADVEWPTENIPTARAKIERLLRYAGLSDALPQELVRLRERWATISGTIVEMRNEIVHAKNRIEDHTKYLSETYGLCLWTLEILLLKFGGYSGVYSNRLRGGRWVGETERIPC